LNICTQEKNDLTDIGLIDFIDLLLHMRLIINMQKLAFIVFLVILTSCNGFSGKDDINYSNPLAVEFGDPYILLASDGMYYMYGTGGGAVDGFCAYSSDNLVDWKHEGQVYRGNTDISWSVRNFWAPEVYEKDGKFYLLFSADWRHNPTNELENFRIGVAVADSPTGPFEDLSDKPLFDPGYPIIDANLLFEGDKTYLYYSRCCYKNPVESDVAEWARNENLFEEIEESWVYGVEISSDFDTIVGDPILLLRPPVKNGNGQYEWESRSVTTGEVNRRWTEGSFIIKHKDTYYMMYSANYFGGKHYAVGYATSVNPLGPFIKAENNPVLEKNIEKGGVVSGTGHNSITWSKDGKQMYCVYHGRTTKTGNERVVFIDKMRIDDAGQLMVDGPSTEEQTIIR
jgi:beta-xylosidase